VIRATFDVNVLASGFPVKTGTPAQLLARWAAEEYELVLSEHILEGLGRTWQKPYSQLNYGPERAREALLILRRNASLVVPVQNVVGVAKDTEDDLVLATAVAGGVDVLVTGDKALREVNRFRNVAILTPREFLTLLEFEALHE
jgi:putative PIN family toxin of toxin-antitoxin system